MHDPVTFNSLRRFRAGVYGAFGARRDALFDLLDAATGAGLVPSLAYLRLTAGHRRGGGDGGRVGAVARLPDPDGGAPAGVGQPGRRPGGRDDGRVGVAGGGGTVA